jgi:hypothetical protein
MQDKVFIFFGCSWTFGKFIHLQPGQHVDVNALQAAVPFDSREEIDLANKYAYRGLLSKTFNAEQINFSQGGSSNAKQFRLASEYFLGPKRQQIFREDSRPKYVFWFITSSARIEHYNSVTQKFDNEFLARPKSQLSKLILTNYYNHDYELEKLAQQMTLWNSYFAQNNIKNIWIDTFNHHAYPMYIENQLNFQTNYSDLMSNMCLSQGFDQFNDTKSYVGTWRDNDARSEYLKNQELLNPYTLHPTLNGHKLVTDILIPKVVDYFGFVNYNQHNE